MKRSEKKLPENNHTAKAYRVNKVDISTEEEAASNANLRQPQITDKVSLKKTLR